MKPYISMLREGTQTVKRYNMDSSLKVVVNTRSGPSFTPKVLNSASDNPSPNFEREPRVIKRGLATTVVR